MWAIHNNAQRFMPNFFRKGQLTKLFFSFAAPHFKKRNHRKRLGSEAHHEHRQQRLAPIRILARFGRFVLLRHASCLSVL